MAVAVAAAEALTDLSGSSGRHHSSAAVHASSPLRILVLIAAAMLLSLAPGLWLDSRKAPPRALAALLVLCVLEVVGGVTHHELVLEASLTVLLVGWVALQLRSVDTSLGATRPSAHEMAIARGLVKSHGEDSLAPFILRPDKDFHLANGAVLAYGVIGRTAVVSGDPVGPPGSAAEVLGSFKRLAAARGWRVAIYGASTRHLETYRHLGFRLLCVGEEAVVDPSRFTLEGRPVRKLRQSVHRVARHGWAITTREGREIDAGLEAEIESVEQAWRSRQRRLFGFTMGMGVFEGGVAPGDLYVLGRAPDGHLNAVMRFISHRGKLSLDTMRRIGTTPNGLNEAMVCHVLLLARRRNIREVSLNYAGLAHVVRRGPHGSWLARATLRLSLPLLSRYFQMHRLVRFNQKFDPDWRPRYLVYESRLTLPASVLRVLQAEGYFGSRRGNRAAAEALVAHAGPRTGWRRLVPARTRSLR